MRPVLYRVPSDRDRTTTDADTITPNREMMEILRRVEAHTGCATLVAYAWFRSEPLPGLDGMTPHQLVRRGRADHVHAYLDQVTTGGYA